MTVTAAECPCGTTTVLGPNQLWTHCDGCGLIVRKPTTPPRKDVDA